MTQIASGCPNGASAGPINVTIVFCFDILASGSTTLYPYGYGLSGTQLKYDYGGGGGCIFNADFPPFGFFIIQSNKG